MLMADLDSPPTGTAVHGATIRPPRKFVNLFPIRISKEIYGGELSRFISIAYMCIQCLLKGVRFL
jgi:hypothetical protein